MSNIWVTLYWAVPEVIWEKEIVSLTWSATVLNMQWNKILIDIWLFQWGEWSDMYNKENTKFINDLDAVFITHSHIDHIWRLPLLYKLWFRWPIYMTKATKEITYEMLLDCLKIQEWDAIIREKKSKTLIARIEKSLKIKSELLAELKKKRRLDETKQNDLKEIEEYLSFYDIETEHNIEKLLLSLKSRLFNMDDINWVMWLIKIVEYNDEILLDPKRINTQNNNREDQDILNNLPKKVSEWFTDKMEVDRDSEARKLKKLWVKDLLSEIKNLLSDKKLKYKDINKKLSKKLQEAFTFCFNEYPAFTKGNNWVYRKDSEEYENKYKEFSRLLKFYWIVKREDIDDLYERTKNFINVLNSKSVDDIVENWFNPKINKWIDDTIDVLSKIIETFNLKPSFNIDDINQAYDNIIVLNQKNKKRNSLSITFTDAAHLVWASSVTLTTSLYNKKVNKILEAWSDSVSVFFSWDMWRITNNRLWRPEIPPRPVDYLQIESTYGWRNHRDRDESVRELMDMIEKSEWNVLISVFSQQRLQEILLTIFEEKEKRWEDYLPYDILVDAPLWEKVTDKYIKFKWDVYDPLKKWFYRFLWENEWQFIYMDVLEWSENEFSIPKKSIILASSGMMEWWAIINHLPFILNDPKATLLAPGYLSRWTLWNEIIWWDNKFVTVDWTKCEIKCNKKFIDWFSSHIWHDEIIQYICETLETGRLKAWSTIALSHGNKDGQLLLKAEIEEILNSDIYKDLWIIVTIPSIFEEYDVIERKVNDYKEEAVSEEKKDLAIEKIVYKKPVVPKKVLESEVKEVKVEQEKTPQVIIEERNRNKREIIQTKILWDIISKRRNDFIEKYLDRFLTIFQIDYVNRVESKISKLSANQRKEFYSNIDKKLTRNETIDKQISNIWKKNTNIKTIKDEVVNFFKSLKVEYINKINDLKKQFEKVELEISELKSHLYDLENTKWEKNDEYKKSLKDLRKKLRSKDTKLKHFDSQIKNLKNSIVNSQNSLYKLMKYNLSDDYVDGFKDIFNSFIIEYSDDLSEKFYDLCEKNIEKNDNKIRKLLEERKLHIKIKLEKSSPNFWWRDLYYELYSPSDETLDLNKLQDLINSWFFNTHDLSYINSKLSILRWSDTWKREKKWTMNHLVSYFKEKRNENKDRWINFTFFIEDLNKRILKLFSTIFEKDEYYSEIVENFDIYSFLKSKLSLREYVSTKLNVEKLEWINVYLKEFEEKDDKITQLLGIIESIETLSDKSNSVNELKDYNFWISTTRLEVEEILWIKRAN